MNVMRTLMVATSSVSTLLAPIRAVVIRVSDLPLMGVHAQVSICIPVLQSYNRLD